jgi:hypothetical protein
MTGMSKARVRARCIVTGRLTDCPLFVWSVTTLVPGGSAVPPGPLARRTGGGAKVGTKERNLIAGARSIPSAAARTAVMRRLISAEPRCWGSGAGADRTRSPARRLGPAAPGRPVHRARTEAGIRVRPQNRNRSLQTGGGAPRIAASRNEEGWNATIRREQQNGYTETKGQH